MIDTDINTFHKAIEQYRQEYGYGNIKQHRLEKIIEKIKEEENERTNTKKHRKVEQRKG